MAGGSGTAIFAYNKLIVTNGSMSSNITSTSYEVKEQKTLFIQAVWSSGVAPEGILELKGSTDSDGTYTRIEGSVLDVTGNSGSDGWNLANIGYPYIQCVYTRTSGTGILNVKICGKYV